MRRGSTRRASSAGRPREKRKYAREPEKKEERKYGFSERIYLRIL